MACEFEQQKGMNGFWIVTGAPCSGDLPYTDADALAAWLWDGDDGSTPLAEIPSDQLSWYEEPTKISVSILADDIAAVDPGTVYLIVTAAGDHFATAKLHVMPGTGD